MKSAVRAQANVPLAAGPVRGFGVALRDGVDTRIMSPATPYTATTVAVFTVGTIEPSAAIGTASGAGEDAGRRAGR